MTRAPKGRFKSGKTTKRREFCDVLSVRWVNNLGPMRSSLRPAKSIFRDKEIVIREKNNIHRKRTARAHTDRIGMPRASKKPIIFDCIAKHRLLRKFSARQILGLGNKDMTLLAWKSPVKIPYTANKMIRYHFGPDSASSVGAGSRMILRETSTQLASISC